MVAVGGSIKAIYEGGLPTGTAGQHVEVVVEPQAVRVTSERAYELVPLIEVAAIRAEPADEPEWAVETDYEHGGLRSTLRLRTQSQTDAVALEQTVQQAKLGRLPVAGPSTMVTQPATLQRKEPVLALVLSLLWCGAGQIYNGEGAKGVFMMIGYALSIAAIFILIFLGIGLLTTPALWIYGMADAYRTAERLNRQFAQTR